MYKVSLLSNFRNEDLEETKKNTFDLSSELILPETGSRVLKKKVMYMFS